MARLAYSPLVESLISFVSLVDLFNRQSHIASFNLSCQAFFLFFLVLFHFIVGRINSFDVTGLDRRDVKKMAWKRALLSAPIQIA
jgi:hypothetical protein